jgi:hypothetical protein
MRLLSVSRSFCSNVPEMGRYRLSRRGALPDFRRLGDGEQVGRRATQGELAMAGRTRVVEESGQGKLALGRIETGGARVGNEGAKAVFGRSGRVEMAKEMAGKEAVEKGGAGLRGWLGRLARGWRGWMQPKSRRRAKRLPVQTAFALEKVLVVRNDLTEADMELVVLKAKRGGVAERGKVSEGETGRPLARIAAKLFTSGRSR